MEKLIKEDVLQDYIEMIKHSWTYARLTETEKANLFKTLNSVQVTESLKGSYKQRWNILQSIYTAFLYALDYSPFHWRDPEDEDIPF